MSDKVRGPYGPQQVIAPGYPGVAPPKGWVPPLGGVLNLIGVYDTDLGAWVGLPIETLTEALVLAESRHAVDRIDDRNKKEATIPAGSAVGEKKTAEIEVPSGEVWFINRLVLTSPAESGPGIGDIVKVSIRVSRWPENKAYWSAAKGTAALDTYTIDLPAQGELGEELRLSGGDKLTLEAELTGAVAGANLVASLSPYGRKGKRLVE